MKHRHYIIYGIFTVEAECLYVGATSDFVTRSKEHFCSKRFRGMFLAARVLKNVLPQSAAFQEARHIRKYKSLGQATFNKNMPRCVANRILNGAH